MVCYDFCFYHGERGDFFVVEQPDNLVAPLESCATFKELGSVHRCRTVVPCFPLHVATCTGHRHASCNAVVLAQARPDYSKSPLVLA